MISNSIYRNISDISISIYIYISTPFCVSLNVCGIEAITVLQKFVVCSQLLGYISG